MKKIIEVQKMRSFMKKVDLEWEGKIRSYIFTSDDWGEYASIPGYQPTRICSQSSSQSGDVR